MTDKRFRVQKLPVHKLYTLHQPILPASSQTPRENTPIIQRRPSEASPLTAEVGARVVCRVRPRC